MKAKSKKTASGGQAAVDALRNEKLNMCLV